MSDLVEILRAYIPGEPAHEEFTAERIAQAADEIERLRKQLEATEQKWSERYKDQAKECLDWKHQAEALHKQLVGARHNAIEECAKVAEAQAQEFLSPKYAANQPYGSICERFACVEAAKAIRALLTDEIRGSE